MSSFRRSELSKPGRLGPVPARRQQRMGGCGWTVGGVRASAELRVVRSINPYFPSMLSRSTPVDSSLPASPALQIQSLILRLQTPIMPGPGVGFEYRPQEVSWYKRDALLFANSIGVTADELHFLYVWQKALRDVGSRGKKKYHSIAY